MMNSCSVMVLFISKPFSQIYVVCNVWKRNWPGIPEFLFPGQLLMDLGGCLDMIHPIRAMSIAGVGLFGFLFPSMAWAQVALYGIQQGNNQELILSSYEVVDGLFYDEDTLDFVSAYLVGGTAFDQIQGTYYLTGLTSLSSGQMSLWGMDIATDEVISETPVDVVVGGIQHDMNTDRLMAMGSAIVDSTLMSAGGVDWWMYEYATRLIELDPATGIVDEVATYPEITGYVLGCVALNSNNGHIYVIGVDDNYEQRVYTLNSYTGEVISSPIVQTDLNWGLNELVYSMESSKLYALHREYGDIGEGEIHVAAIDPETGAVANLLELPQVAAISPGASEFAQTEGLYIIMYYDANFNQHLLAVNPESSILVADHLLPASFTEMHVDNSAFAAAAYGSSRVGDVVGLPTASSQMKFVPNPSQQQTEIRIVGPAAHEPGFLTVCNAQGQTVFKSVTSEMPPQHLNTSGWPPGVYAVSWTASEGCGLSSGQLLVVP